MRHPLSALPSTRLKRAVLAALVAAAVPALAGTAVVSYDHPERFTDAGRGRDADAVRATLTDHLEALARTRLPEGLQLSVDITDIDLAGEIPPMASARLSDVRVLGRPVDWPRISLRYTLRDGERVLAQGSDVVSDMSYLERAGLRSHDGRLPYERRMLTEWFGQRFGAAAGH